MGTGPRNKRRAYEHETEIVKLAEKHGLKATRAFASRGSSRGWDEAVDVLIEGATDIKVQAKRRKALADYLKPPEGADIVVVREDHGNNFAVVPFELLLWLLVNLSP